MTPHFESLTVVYPAWNEEATIERAVDAAREVLTGLVEAGEIGRYEIVVVDDASTDRTGEIVDAQAAADPCVVAVHHDVNRKLGGSIRTGFAHATGELVLYTDADLPFDMADTAKAVRLLRVYDADIVSAYRFDRTGEGPRRMVYSHAYNQLVRSMFGLRVRDVNFAFKLVRRCVLDNMELVSEGSFIDVELLVRAHRLGYHIIQFGVDYFPRSRGVSTLSSNAVIARIVRELRDLRTELAGIEPLPPEVRRRRRERP
ncbi:MAG: glycosyltransferase family 2 protein [Acidimicrobiales bacterium]|nr:glycosyltransferase family 2 protein [Acidimicrobiales bacterium]